MKHFFIINPVAGKDKGKQSIKHLINDLAEKHNLTFEIHYTISKDDAKIFVEQKCKENHKDTILRFYACGGDGTLNEVINGCATYDNAQVANFPCGTGNDFLSNFGGIHKFSNMENLILAKTKPIDLLKIDMLQNDIENVRYAINTASVGFDSNIAYEMNTFRKVPFLKGNSVYYASLLYCLSRKINTKLTLTLDNGELIEDEFLLVCVGNGTQYGGGFKATPKAVLDDGLMDVCAIKKIGRAKILNLVKLYEKGEHLSSEKLKHLVTYKQVKTISLQGITPLRFAYDGECHICDKITISVLHNKINFVVMD